MCMPLDRRLQLLLDEEQYRRVAAAARAQRVSVAAVIRDAIDRGLAPHERKRDLAARLILGATPMDVPPADDLIEELRALRGRE